tara:strand:+ start:50 stop:376 length:327 start_codon:yes stop_codon:yes gene_type:complete
MGLTKRAILHQTIHIGCKCHASKANSGSKANSHVKEKTEKKFVPRRPYNIKARAKKRANNVGRVVSTGYDPLAWLNPLPEMKKIESKAERTLQMRLPERRNFRGGKMF